MKYGVISDTHYHLFSQFSGAVDKNGTNDRLRIQLAATLQAAKAMKKAGCTHLIHAGDMFHVRGAVSPIVLNSVKAVYEVIADKLGLEVIVIAGNHDLETTNSVFTANASSALTGAGIKIVCGKEPVEFGDLTFISWMENKAELMDTLKRLSKEDLAEETSVFIHAPLNEVIPGIPDTGLAPSELAELGFQFIFSGHYHNHKAFKGSVYSVGALTHHNWGDVNSKAGYLIVDNVEGTVEHFETSAPKFLDFASCEEEEIAGNYIRVTGLVESDEEAADAKRKLEAMGAAGVVASFVKTATVVSTTSETAKIDSLNSSISSYAKRYAETAELDADTLIETCLDVLSEAEGLME